MLQNPLLAPVVPRSSLFRLVLLLLVLLSLWGTPQAAIPDQQEQLLQFTAAGHVLGFQRKGLYVASGDHMLHVGFVGTPGVTPEAAEASEVGNKSQPLTRVIYHNLWSGINLRYESAPGGIAESTWEITAGARIEQIRLRYNAPLKITADGSLKIEFETGSMRESAPIAWQEIGGRLLPVEVAFQLLESPVNEQVIGFKVGDYVSRHPLLIDPALTWNTFMGSEKRDEANELVMDVWGNVYVVGLSEASWGTPVEQHAGDFDAFVAKLDTNGNLLWNTFLGSTSFDDGQGIAVDVWGNVYITGTSLASWGSPVNPYIEWDAFVTKLDTNGNLQWNTFLGSGYWDKGNSIAVGFWGNRVYVVGSSGGSWGKPLIPYAGKADAFMAGLVGSTGALIGNTFIGSSDSDNGNAIALDNNLNVYVAGTSSKKWGTPINSHSGGLEDAFVAKFNVSGGYLWHTFLGSTGRDIGNAIAIDSNSNICVAGTSDTAWGNPVNGYVGDDDAFSAKLDTNGNLQWNTFMGSALDDYGTAIKADGLGNIFVGGASYATWGSPVMPHVGGGTNGFAVKLDKNGTRLRNTFFGSTSGGDFNHAIKIDALGNVHVAGMSYATWGLPVEPYMGYSDGYVAKLDGNLKLYTEGLNFVIIKYILDKK